MNSIQEKQKERIALFIEHVHSPRIQNKLTPEAQEFAIEFAEFVSDNEAALDALGAYLACLPDRVDYQPATVKNTVDTSKR